MPQELRIKPVLNGWIVQAGCQTLVYSDPVVMADEFRDWLKNPAQVEGKYTKLMQARGIGPTDCGDQVNSSAPQAPRDLYPPQRELSPAERSVR